MRNKPRIFERILDLEGRLRLPDFLFDDYGICYISLGLFSRTYLQITPEGIYLVMSDALGMAPFTDKESFKLQRNLHTAERLKLDPVGRIQIPLRLLERAAIVPGASVVGEAISTELTPEESTYWALYDKTRWLEGNPAGAYSLDLL